MVITKLILNELPIIIVIILLRNEQRIVYKIKCIFCEASTLTCLMLCMISFSLWNGYFCAHKP